MLGFDPPVASSFAMALHNSGDSQRKQKRERKKLNKKRNKWLLHEVSNARAASEISATNAENAMHSKANNNDVKVDVVPAPPEMDAGVSKDDPALQELASVIRKFSLASEDNDINNLKASDPDEEEEQSDRQSDENTIDAYTTSIADTEAGSGVNSANSHLSRRQLKRRYRPAIADLKTRCAKPEVVEVWDAASPDPTLLVHLKAHRNTVPVPRHWSAKRRYLQGKRGIEKPPFKLPDFIEATGIQKLREGYHEKENEKSLRQQQRERVRPKTGRIDIDYQVLHDAFFKHQTKPKLSSMGDLYYEGKEFELDLSNKKPGKLSDELKNALGMTDELSPPPWLSNMQRYGPPPSYPGLRIPGLNAPIPEGASYGHHPGGWGRPPVDEHGKPIYGDPFGQQHTGLTDVYSRFDKPPEPGKRWGEDLVEAESEEEEEDHGEKDEADEDEEAAEDREQPLGAPSERELREGVTSVGSTPSGVSTPQEVQLRKDQPGGEEPAAQMQPQPQQLYRVLEEKESGAPRTGVMGTTHTYNVRGTQDEQQQQHQQSSNDVALTLQPEELEQGVQEEQIAQKYESEKEALKEQKQGEDLSDMVAEHEAKRKRKRGEAPSSSQENQQGKGRSKRFKF